MRRLLPVIVAGAWFLLGCRSSAKAAAGAATLFESLRSLLFMQPGFFRILVFVVSAEPLNQRGRAAAREEAESWVRSGASALPSAVGEAEYTKRHATTALVYEFVQAEKDKPAVFDDPGRLSALEHLQAAGVWKALRR